MMSWLQNSHISTIDYEGLLSQEINGHVWYLCRTKNADEKEIPPDNLEYLNQRGIV